jgi:hypothetical protein
VKYSLSVESGIPAFEPHFLLKNGHAMTIASAFIPRQFDIPLAKLECGNRVSYLLEMVSKFIIQ